MRSIRRIASSAAAAAVLAACPAGAAPAGPFGAKADAMPAPGTAALPPPPRASTPVPPLREIGKQRPARPRIALSHLLGDYPAAALRAGEQGMVEFRLDLDALGRVTGCAIAESSGSAMLDQETCRRLTVRARFIPALDSEGRPTVGQFAGRIVWRLPPPPEPPLPAADR